MSGPDFTSPREAARAFTPELSRYVENPLYAQVWERGGLSKRERSIATVAALVALRALDELPAHLRRGVENGVDTRAFSELITHLAFYAGFPAAISASVRAAETLGPLGDG
ncbi:carboxymuconolactone decarboxylase family protein [Sphingomonas sp. H39-1-10]|uniref:carboxymuconolactone decarboxylase family protein n=1 Tax=Sphingomonas pollutisoli TaxID=3030829 RepID=UPI0023B8D4AF|nr:carboxymuconolactone decarboxylase family protein [Sphingomonas pollutisoli]MDF0489774.1 carboxymuconolactone decarboxylase family protein [Sphingomonas pollutisoli]